MQMTKVYEMDGVPAPMVLCRNIMQAYVELQAKYQKDPQVQGTRFRFVAPSCFPEGPCILFAA
jgi:hypothetical protein